MDVFDVYCQLFETNTRKQNLVIFYLSYDVVKQHHV